jgi:uncharacterized membrane protein YoaK (UPF0700 family)
MIKTTSLLLTAVAAFTDSATFVGADKLFSAHVTGNFIVLAYDIIHGADVNEWSKLLAFPVFFGAVMVAGRIANRSSGAVLGEGQADALAGRGGVGGSGVGPVVGGSGVGLVAGGSGARAVSDGGDRLLRIEGVLLLLAGLAAVGMWWGHFSQVWLLVLISMIIVVAMAFQNAFGRLYVKRVYGPTTVMTGNVTSAALDIAALLLDRKAHPEKIVPLRHNLAMILVFLLGCFAGATCAYFLGLAAVIAPGVFVLLFLARSSVVAARSSVVA